LGCLRQPEHGPVHCPPDNSFRVHLLDGILDRDTERHGAVSPAFLNRLENQLFRNEGSDGIMNDHDIIACRLRSQGKDSILHGILSFLSSRQDLPDP